MLKKETYKGFTKTKLQRRCFEKGESIEEMVRRSIASKEPIEATKNVIFTPKKDGVIPAYNPRTDKQTIAVNQLDKATRQLIMQGAALQSIEEQAAAEAEQAKEIARMEQQLETAKSKQVKTD